MTVHQHAPTLPGAAGAIAPRRRRGRIVAGPARRRARRAGADRAAQHVHHLQPGRAVQQQPGGHDPGPGRGHPGRRGAAGPGPGPGPPAGRPVLELADPGGPAATSAGPTSPRSRSAQSIGQRLPVDLSIAVLAVILAVIIGGGAGTVAAVQPRQLVRPRRHPRRARRRPPCPPSWSASSWWSCSRSRPTCCRPTATSGRAPASRRGWSTSSCPPWRSACGLGRHRPAAAHLAGRGARAELHRRRPGPRPALPAHPDPARAAQRVRPGPHHPRQRLPAHAGRARWPPRRCSPCPGWASCCWRARRRGTSRSSRACCWWSASFVIVVNLIVNITLNWLYRTDDGIGA